MELDIQSRRSDSAQPSCAYCHDPVNDEGHICAFCQTILHIDCQAELGRCPTLGCKEAGRNARKSHTTNPADFVVIRTGNNRDSELSIFPHIANFLGGIVQYSIVLAGGAAFLYLLLLIVLCLMHIAYGNDYWVPLIVLLIAAFLLIRIIQWFYRRIQ